MAKRNRAVNPAPIPRATPPAVSVASTPWWKRKLVWIPAAVLLGLVLLFLIISWFFGKPMNQNVEINKSANGPVAEKSRTFTDEELDTVVRLLKEREKTPKQETEKFNPATKSYDDKDCEELDGEGNCVYRTQKLPPEMTESGQETWYLVPPWAKSAVVERDSGTLPFIAFERIHKNGCHYLIVAGENVKAGKMVSIIPTFTSEVLVAKSTENVFVVRVN